MTLSNNSPMICWSIAGPIVSWLLKMVAAQVGAEYWVWISLFKGLVGAGIDGIGMAAIGYALFQLGKT